MTGFLITLLILLCTALMLWGAFVVYSRITADKVLQNGRQKKSFLFNYLSLRFSRLSVIRDVSLVVKNNANSGGKYISNIGLVFVNQGGLFIIDSVQGSGFIDINERSQWHRIINDNYYTFDDPIEKNIHKVKEVKWFLRSEGVENVPVHSLVVFTGKRIKFSKKLRGLITVDELAPYLVDLNKDRFLSQKEIRDVVKLIKSKQG